MASSMQWHDYKDECKSAWGDAAASFYLNGYSPISCPCCREGILRVYWNAHFEDISPDGRKRRRGGGWMWCPTCQSYEHWSGLVPDWWPTTDRIVPENELYHSPVGIDERWEDIFRNIAGKRIDGCHTVDNTNS